MSELPLDYQQELGYNYLNVRQLHHSVPMTSDPITPRTPFARLRIQKASELLAQQIRAAVLLGELPEGSVLPSEKELTDQFGVSRATVREGLRLLEAEGLIVTRVGRGG